MSLGMVEIPSASARRVIKSLEQKCMNNKAAIFDGPWYVGCQWFCYRLEEQSSAKIDHDIWKFLFKHALKCPPLLYCTLDFFFFPFSVAASVNTTVKVHMIIPQMVRTKKPISILQCFLSTCSLWGGNKPTKSTILSLCHLAIEMLRALLPFPSTLSCIVSVCQFVLDLLKLSSNLTQIAIEYLFFFLYQSAWWL